jgi:hypothetical protein
MRVAPIRPLSARDGLFTPLEGSQMPEGLKTARDLWEATVHYRRLAALAPETEAAGELRRLAAWCERKLRDLEGNSSGVADAVREFADASTDLQKADAQVSRARRTGNPHAVHAAQTARGHAFARYERADNARNKKA